MDARGGKSEGRQEEKAVTGQRGQESRREEKIKMVKGKKEKRGKCVFS